MYIQHTTLNVYKYTWVSWLTLRTRVRWWLKEKIDIYVKMNFMIDECLMVFEIYSFLYQIYIPDSRVKLIFYKITTFIENYKNIYTTLSVSVLWFLKLDTCIINLIVLKLMIPPVRCVSCVIENTKFDISFVNRFLLNLRSFPLFVFLIRVSYQFNRKFHKRRSMFKF